MNLVYFIGFKRLEQETTIYMEEVGVEEGGGGIEKKKKSLKRLIKNINIDKYIFIYVKV